MRCEMTKHDLDLLVFWYQERKELEKFRNMLNYSAESKLIKTEKPIWSVITGKSYKQEFLLTDIQRTKLWAFLDAEVKHLDSLIKSADEDDRAIAEDIFNGNIGKKALGYLDD